MEPVLANQSGLCGFDQFSFLRVKDEIGPKTCREIQRGELFALKAILEVEKDHRYTDVDFGSFLHFYEYPDLGMTRGEHLFRLFAGGFRGKTWKELVIFVILRHEAKPGHGLAPKLFARSLPMNETKPGRWMNSRDPWQYIDDSIMKQAVLETTL